MADQALLPPPSSLEALALPRTRGPARVQPWVLAAFIPALDGLRGVAILMVLVCHFALFLPASSLTAYLGLGAAGVDLFFVLSGFLITRILLAARGNPRYYRNFYARRILRIWPLYYGLVIVAFTAARHWTPAAATFWMSLLFVQNLAPLVQLGPVLQPTWSLGVEEQYYLVWPLFVSLLPSRALKPLVISVIALSPALRYVAASCGLSATTLYCHSLFRLDGIAMGCAIALWTCGPGASRKGFRVAAYAMTYAGLVAAILLLRPGAWPLAHEVLESSALTLLFGGILGLTLLSPAGSGPVSGLMNQGWLRHVGKISFGLYLYHLPIYSFFHTHLIASILSPLGSVPAREFFTLFAENVLLLVVASASWYWIETPILRLKRHFSA